MKLDDDYKGSVSEGTLNPYIVAVTINNFMKDIRANESETIPGLEQTIIEDSTDFSCMGYEEITQYINEDQFDILDEIAPENCYFGAHPGDGADFGFWEYEE